MAQGTSQGNQVRGNQMPLARGNGLSEMPQRPRPRLHLKTATSESDGGQQTVRRRVDRSPRLSDRRSLRASATDQKKATTIFTLQKKRSNQISDLETQLGQAQDEMKKLKEQLAWAENAKKEAEVELKETKKISDSFPDDVQEPNKTEIFAEAPETLNGKGKSFPVEKNNEPLKDNVELQDADHASDIVGIKEENNKSTVILIEETADERMAKNESRYTHGAESADIELLKAKALQKEQELVRLFAEKEELKLHLLKMEELKTKEEEESNKKLSRVTRELEQSKQIANGVGEELKALFQAKTTLEAEMKLLKIQAEQWKKAAETATSILASIDNLGGSDINHHYAYRQRHASDKSVYIGLDKNSPLCETTGGGYGGKHKGGSGGIKMFGDLWRKKGQRE